MPSKATKDETLKLRLIIKAPPAGVDYGLQKGHANVYEVVQLQRSGTKDLSFELEVGVKEASGNKAAIDFKGPFVQGKAGERFFYVDIGTYAGQTGCEYSRKLKIPLRGISKAAVKNGKVLQTAIAGVGKDGGPSCATPKDFAGWR